MPRYLNILALVLVAALVGACSSTQPVGTQVDDVGIATKVKAKLTADPEINPFNINVDVNEGVVRLSGAVEKEQARDEAVRLARDTEGVTRVINDIVIGDRSIGERLDDTALATKIKAKLTADPDVNPFNVNVQVTDGVVTLMGRVKDTEHRTHIEKMVRDTQGVVRVNNRLEVGEAGR